MRISYLRRREPIFQIIERTLARYWSDRLDDTVTVEWTPSRSRLPAVDWFCNAWLNVIFPPDVNRKAFEPTLREYARSTVAWRRPLQQTYAHWATMGRCREWLGSGPLRVSHAIPDQQATVIIPGNNKLRVLNHDQQQCHSLLKAGFPTDRFEREVESRRIASRLGLPIPRLVQQEDSRSFSEQYVAGTPLNRLPDKTDQHRCWLVAAGSLHPLLEHTATTQDVKDYVNDTASRIRRRIGENQLLAWSAKTQLVGLLDELLLRVGAGPYAPQAITTALTHGDFQAANILVENDRVWIIDWEYSDVRQAGFDALVTISAARSPAGLAARLRQWVTDPDHHASHVVAAMDPPGMQCKSPNQRSFHALLFWLEELDFHLGENANPNFRCLNHGFAGFARELEEWLT